MSHKFICLLRIWCPAYALFVPHLLVMCLCSFAHWHVLCLLLYLFILVFELVCFASAGHLVQMLVRPPVRSFTLG